MNQGQHNLDILKISTKEKYNTINDIKNEGIIQYRLAEMGENLLIVKNIQDKIIAENMRDVVWLISRVSSGKL